MKYPTQILLTFKGKILLTNIMMRQEKTRGRCFQYKQ